MICPRLINLYKSKGVEVAIDPFAETARRHNWLWPDLASIYLA